MANPDDLMAIEITLKFFGAQTKLGKGEIRAPYKNYSRQFHVSPSHRLEETVAELEELIRAIREQRLYGFMHQSIAEVAVGAGWWAAPEWPEPTEAPKPDPDCKTL